MIRFVKRFGSCAFVAAACVVLVSPVSTVAVGQESGPVLEEIIVTAARRAESIQDSSLIIEAFSSDTIFEQGLDTMVGISSAVPSLQIGLAGPQLQMYMRGVGTPTATVVGSPAIALSKDGAYLARSQSVHAAFFDLQRIEVLKGPQGTLYGRNATGGAVNLITNPPVIGETGGYLSADVGNFSKAQLEGAINIPAGENVAVRLSGTSVERDGYMSDGTMDDDHYAARAQLLWEPSDRVSLKLQGQYADYGGRGLGGFTYFGASDPWESVFPGGNSILAANIGPNGLAVPGPVFPWVTDSPVLGPAPSPPFPPGSNFISGIDFYADTATQDLQTWDVGFELNVDMDWATLTVMPSYQEIESSFRNTPGPRFQIGDPFTGEPETSEATLLEARLSNQTDRLDWVAGIYLFNEDQYGPTRVDQGAAQNLFVQNSFETEAYGIFGQATYSFSDTARLIAGIRYSDDEITKPDFIRWSVDQAFNCPPVAPNREVVNGIAACRVSGPTTDVVSFDSTDWKLGLEFDVGDDTMLFLTASTGYKAGGFSAVVSNAYQPEELDAIEFGWRNLFLDGRLQFNGDIFYWDYTDRQENIVGPDSLGIIGQDVVNAGETTIQGIGFDMVFAATDRDIIRFGAEFLDASYDSFSFRQAAPFTPPSVTCPITLTGVTINLPPPFGPVPEQQIDCTGFEATRSPEWTANIAYTRTFNLSNGGTLDWNISGSYKDQIWTTALFLAEQRVPSLTLWNTSFTYRPANERFSLVAYANNISEDATFSAGLNHTQVPQLVAFSPTNPRTYGVRLRWDF